MTNFCPCHSGMIYEECCKPFHTKKKTPQLASQLMRARYAAYALNIASYIIATTHPKNPQYKANLVAWKKEIQEFSKNTLFISLDILTDEELDNVAFVTFQAQLKENNQEIIHKEKSTFTKENNKWLYRDCQWL